MNLDYNFVILGSPWELYLSAYSDIINLPDVIYVPEPQIPAALRLLYKIHLHPKINGIVNIPGKTLWNRLLFDVQFSDNEKPICFILFSDWYCRNTDLIKFIRNKYKDSKIVIMFQDLIGLKHMYYSNEPINIDKLKSEVDLVISFDFNDARKYNIEYHNIPYSKSLDSSSNKPVEYDIYFLGQAKNRLSEILDTYFILNNYHLKLNFILAGVPKKQRKALDGITYVENGAVSYKENLNHIQNSRCILEIMQKNGTGYTIRTLEALAYGKKLLTNNQYILKAPFYNPGYISYFSSPDKINKDFLDNLSVKPDIDDKFITDLSPIKLLEFIEKKLSYHK